MKLAQLPLDALSVISSLPTISEAHLVILVPRSRGSLISSLPCVAFRQLGTTAICVLRVCVCARVCVRAVWVWMLCGWVGGWLAVLGLKEDRSSGPASHPLDRGSFAPPDSARHGL